MVSIIKKLRIYDQLTRQTLHSSHRHWDKAIMALKPLLCGDCLEVSNALAYYRLFVDLSKKFRKIYRWRETLLSADIFATELVFLRQVNLF